MEEEDDLQLVVEDECQEEDDEEVFKLLSWLKKELPSPTQNTTLQDDNDENCDNDEYPELSQSQIDILRKAQVKIKHTKLTLFGMLQTESSVLKQLVHDDCINESDDMTFLTAQAPITQPEASLGGTKWKKTDDDFLKGIISKSLEFAKELKVNGKQERKKKMSYKRSGSRMPPRRPMRRSTQPDSIDAPPKADAHCVSIIHSKCHNGFMDIAPSLLDFHPLNIVTFRSNNRSSVSTTMTSYQQFLQSSFTSLVSLKDCLQESSKSPVEPFESTNQSSTVAVRYNDDECTPLYRYYIVSPEPLQEGVTLQSVFGNTLDKLAKSCYNECINPLENFDNIREDISRHGIIAHIPTQWILLQYVLEKARDNQDFEPMVEFSYCEWIGELFGMTKDHVKKALVYFHNMSIFLYFQDVLPELVFLQPQPFIKKLINLMNTCELKKKNGVCERKAIKKIEFDGFELQKDHFEYLMSRIFVIAKLPDNDEFFFPGVLGFATPSELPKYDTIEPLVIVLPKELVFPTSLFLALVFKLLSCEMFKINNAENTTQYRNAISLSCKLGGSVALINSGRYLEIYYSGKTKNCFKIRTIIEEEIPKIVDENGWRESLRKIKFCFFCSIKGHETHSRHLCELNDDFDVITCCDDDSSVGTTSEELGRKKEWATDQIIRRSGFPSISKVLDILCTGPDAIQHKWKDLARALGLNPDLLDVKDSDTLVTKLSKVLQKWQDTAPREQFTWNVLIEAIRKEYLSPAKAKEIEQIMGF